jgi:hypothetical protein
MVVLSATPLVPLTVEGGAVVTAKLRVIRSQIGQDQSISIHAGFDRYGNDDRVWAP